MGRGADDVAAVPGARVDGGGGTGGRAEDLEDVNLVADLKRDLKVERGQLRLSAR